MRSGRRRSKGGEMNGRRALESLPIFTDVRRREQAIHASRKLRRIRRRIFESVGSARYSRPEIDALRAHLDFDGGFFVEAGANDGFRQSNTYYLERFRGWRGVLVEPIPELHRRCVTERPGSRCFNCALVGPDHSGDTLEMRYSDLGSRLLDGESSAPALTCFGWAREYDVRVPARTLSDLLDEVRAPRVDFLSLDLEGYEEDALAGLDLERHRPTYLLVEAFDTEGRLPRLMRLFAGRYELVDRITSSDLLFKATS
jgi:FkbM family methyltransferase